jgi:hypothetical protein
MLSIILLHRPVEIDKKSLVLSQPLTGETQLRAKRTRIKILRAIAERNGTAGFSDIKVATGLSTGSIYYHLERMSNYVTKDAKHYIITEDGLRLLREADSRYARAPPAHGSEESAREHLGDSRHIDDKQDGEPAARRDFSKPLRVAFLGGLALLGTLGAIYFTGWGNVAMLPLRNSIPILFSLLVIVLAVSFSFRSRRLVPQAIGYRGVMLSVLSAAAVLSGIMFLSAPYSGAAAPHYDNSMDALLSSYSLHWQVR